MSDLERIFYWRGISDNYLNYRGEHTHIPLENRLKLLQAMGVDTSDPTSLKIEALNLDFKPWLSWLPALVVTDSGAPKVDISVIPTELEDQIRWSLSLDGAVLQKGEGLPSELEEVGEYFHQGDRYTRRRLKMDGLDPNYYELNIRSSKRTEKVTVALAPEKAYQPQFMHEQSYVWGFVLQLYTLISDRNWGIGDFSDLATLIELSAPVGVDVLGVNPFHVLHPNLQEHVSPYSPSDRRFLNPLYIDVELVPGFESEFRPDAEIAFLRAHDHVDYPAVKRIKYDGLYACFQNYLIGSTRALSEFIDKAAPSLIAFANFELVNTWQSHDGVAMSVSREALISMLGSEDLVLPVEMHDAAFHCFLQWIAETQLHACQDLALKKGMKIGLIRDLSVGASGGGSEVRSNSDLFCEEASIGAPPDPLALTGQNWGVPPADPSQLRSTGFKLFIELLRSNMASCGALRIDHAMSLYRLWWCPPNESADHGAYIYYPFHELMGILCLESYLSKTAIIAEDLGVVPERFREEMTRRGLFGNRIFYFEKWHNNEFKSPEDYEEFVLTMASNHDVPTMLSWWNETDLHLRSELDLLEPGASLEQVSEFRRSEKHHLLAKLNAHGLLPNGWSVNDHERVMDGFLMDAVLNYCAACASKMFVIQLEDLLMMNDPVNVPGTYKEHKNWSRKITKNLTDVFSDERIVKTLNQIKLTRASLKIGG